MKNGLIIALFLLSFIQTNAQSVYIDSVRINNKLPRRIKLIDFKIAAIKIDSVVTSRPFDKSDPDSIIYIGSSLFWYDSRRDICEAHVIWFDDKIYSLHLGKFIVNKLTSFEDLRKMFPIDCDNTKPIKIYRQEGTFDRCSIPVKDRNGQLWSMRIIFFLKDNKVVRVDFWEPM
jgi:hypothetical protein